MTDIKQMMGQYEEINSLQGVSLFSASDYTRYYKRSQKAKSSIKIMLGDKNRVYFKVDSIDAAKTELNRKFKFALTAAYKERHGFDQGFFSFARLLANSDSVIGNKHNSGQKLTKKINSDPLLGPDITLMYSQIKNQFTIPDCYLVVSVDPYDFITMGVGQGWATCYKPFGQHYTGGYSLGLDNHTFLTYIVTKNPEEEDYNKLSLKKIYRRLGVFTNDYRGISLSTQYPYKNQGFEEFTINTLQGLFLENLKDEDFVIEHSKDIKVYKTRLSQIYNDFTLAPGDKREDLYLGTKREQEVTKYGTAMNCIVCDTMLASDFMPLCPDCEDKQTEGMENWEVFR